MKEFNEALFLLINQVIILLWQHPRPFVIGLGHTYLAHAADSSFPSDHLTLLCIPVSSLP
jgi:undecaprenyl-diphosphatase